MTIPKTYGNKYYIATKDSKNEALAVIKKLKAKQSDCAIVEYKLPVKQSIVKSLFSKAKTKTVYVVYKK